MLVIEHRARIVVGGIAVLLVSTVASAQLPDSIVRARMDSSSICPSVSVRVIEGLPGGSIMMSPITRRVGNRDLGMGVGIGVAPGIGTFGSVSFMSMAEDAPRYEKAHDITIVADDSIRLFPTSEYRRLTGTHIESIDARVSESDLARLSRANRVTFGLGSETFPLTVGQVQALRALIGERNKPLSNREVPTQCVGPSAADLQRKWSNDTYFEFQVDKPARALENGALVHPLNPSTDGLEGRVLAQFVVLENGTADMDTFHVLRSTDERLSEIARERVPQMRFTPAEVGGKKVRQLVQLPFEFKSSGKVPSDTLRPQTRRSDTIMLPSGVMMRRVVIPDSISKLAKATLALPASTSLTVYTEKEVDTPVRNPDGGVLPKTVPAEVVALFGDEQLLEFVVNADGNVEPGTVRILKEHPRVGSAGADNLSGMHFIPAVLGGKRVRQIAQLAMPVSVQKKPR